ncbi:uncharacterized protein LOC106707005 isoform X1 [Latimeria chalumnae]|uniref:uncharacterized protein LOC106707005 isoform X1 n=1 Tax=Latimeria chalumnae TaxID=7897 RepID=UPI00313D9908
MSKQLLGVILLMIWGNGRLAGASQDPEVDLNVEVKNSTILDIQWDSRSDTVLECALAFFLQGSQEVEILLLPRYGSIQLDDLMEGNYILSFTCFDGEATLKSSNVSIYTGQTTTVQPTQITDETNTNIAADGSNEDAEYLTSNVQTGAVFGCLGGIVLVYLSYSFYKKWRQDERLRAFLRLRRNNEIAPYIIF